MQPTYFVKHPDGTYSEETPQPVPAHLFEAMERAGAEQARRADENAEVIREYRSIIEDLLEAIVPYRENADGTTTSAIPDTIIERINVLMPPSV